MVLAFTRFTLEQATKALAGSKVYLYSFFNLGDKIGGGVVAMHRPLYPR